MSSSDNSVAGVGRKFATWTFFATEISRRLQPEKQISRRRSNSDAVSAVGSVNGIAAGGPASVGQNGILLQRVSARVGPGDCDTVARMRNGEIWQAGCFHDGNQRPESTSQGIIAPGHGTAGVVLADGTAEAVLPVGARAAAASNFIPIDRIGLCQCRNAGQGQKTEQNELFHKIRVICDACQLMRNF